MIRLPSTLAALTAPFVASDVRFPGVPIGRSLLDGRPFHLSPVLVDTAVLPSTNSIALGGLGSGKSTTAKIRTRREILHHDHQAVVIDSFGEDSAGEWAPVARSLGGRVIEAGSFALNPCSELLPPPVREQLLRSLVAAVEPAALTTQATHALQHALAHPKASSMGGLVDALVTPEDGRWPAARLAEWGEDVAIALSRYTDGSLAGIFDGRDAGLPPIDLPILSFDFSRLDRSSPAIPALMAAVACWVEHVWLPQSSAIHRHFVVEEAWQILLSPATAELIQRILKNSRKAALSMDVVMHTISDLGEGPARDLARLCEVAHIGRLSPEEAALVGRVFALPAWAVAEIPNLSPGQAVWKVGPHHVDIIETRLDSVEAGLTDTSSRRRAAQEAQAPTLDEGEAGQRKDVLLDDEETDVLLDDEEHQAEEIEERMSLEDILQAEEDEEDEEHQADTLQGEERPKRARALGRWRMPFNVKERAAEQPVTPHPDPRHEAVLQTARAGRYAEAGELAAIGERQDIATHGAVSPHALAWLETRAQVADLSGRPSRAVQYRATVARMAQQHEHEPFWQQDPTTGPAPAWHSIPGHDAAPPNAAMSAPPLPAPEAPAIRPRQRWPYVVVVLALALTAASIVQATTKAQEREKREAVAADYRGRSGAKTPLDGVEAEVVAQWSTDRTSVTVQLRSYFDKNARYLRIEAGERVASTESQNGWYPKSPKITVPVTDPLADVTVKVAVGGRTWQAGDTAPSLTVRLSPAGVAYDGEGRRLPSDL
ncbi:hypothetical protein ACPCAE_33290 [Streptomyces cinereoruber]|uniref:hypothetical protein n=1 Tax=Streptomyces cinereoruber TaxID=67260 RepID=UPI003C2C924D